MPHRLIKLIAWVLLAAALAYPADWTVWSLRGATSGAMGSVEVSEVTVASLKGNKEEYYTGATQTVACSRSVFPQAGSQACWWLRRHAQIVLRY